MKKLIVMMAIMAASVSQAKTYCGVSAENPKQPGTYDQALFYGEFQGPKMLVISKDRTSAKDFNPNDLKTKEQLQALNDQSIVWIRVEQDKATLATGSIDAANSAVNLTPLHAMTVGLISQKQPLFLIANHLSVTCASF
jgi:hypothetical protein